MRALKPTISFSYCFSMPWLRNSRSLCSTSASDVVTMPPSPEVMFLVGYRLNMAKVPKLPTFLPLRAGAVGLGCVLIEIDAPLRGEPAEALDVEGVAVQVDRHDALGLLRDQRGDVVGVQGVVVQLDVSEDRSRAGQCDRVAGGGEGEGRHDDFVAGADAGGEETEVETGGAGVHGDGRASVHEH